MLATFAPMSGSAGTVVTVTGTGFSGATALRFNGVAATNFTVLSATSLTATVPAGATTGPITLTTPSGTSSSGSPFTVAVLGLAPGAVAAALRVYPNPVIASQATTVEWSGSGAAAATVLVLDAVGRVVQQAPLVAGHLLLDGLEKGVYTVRLLTPAASVTRRLMVE